MSDFLTNEEEYLLDELKFVQKIMFEAEGTYGKWENWFIIAENILVFASAQLLFKPQSHIFLIFIGVLGIILSVQFALIQRGNHIYANARYSRWKELEKILSKDLGNNRGKYMNIILKQEEETKKVNWYRPPFTTWSVRKHVPSIFILFWLALLIYCCIALSIPQKNIVENPQITQSQPASETNKQEQALRQAVAASEAAAVQRQGDILSVTLKSDFLFDVDSSVVHPGVYPEIDRLSRVFNQYPDTRIRIEGHTDSTGSEGYNLHLSQRRAEAVKQLLVSKGVSSNRMTVLGYGESRPKAGNDTPYGQQLNRRVEIYIEPRQ